MTAVVCFYCYRVSACLALAVTAITVLGVILRTRKKTLPDNKGREMIYMAETSAV